MSKKVENTLVVLGFIWRIILVLSLLAIGWSQMGCSGGDSTNCMSINCDPDTDAGMMPDANPVDTDGGMPTDGGGQPDTDSDVCANYQWMTHNPWDCDNTFATTCNLQVVPMDGVCLINCPGAFWLCSADDPNCQGDGSTTIVKDPPVRFSFISGGSTITCYERQ